MQAKQIYFPSLENVKAAAKNLEGVAYKTPLNENSNLSKHAASAKSIWFVTPFGGVLLVIGWG